MSLWLPLTPTPERGQGPWCDLNLGRWWVVADSPAQALAAIEACDAEIFPIYFGWKAIIERTAIRWVEPDEWDEETEIKEAPCADEITSVEAWRMTMVDI